MELAAPGSLEHWLTERYCLYTTDRARRVYRGEIHHAPWPLQRAEAEFSINETTQWLGLSLPSPQPRLLDFARRLDVLVWVALSWGVPLYHAFSTLPLELAPS